MAAALDVKDETGYADTGAKGFRTIAVVFRRQSSFTEGSRDGERAELLGVQGMRTATGG